MGGTRANTREEVALQIKTKDPGWKPGSDCQFQVNHP